MRRDYEKGKRRRILNDIIRQNEEIIFLQHIAEAHNRKMVEQNKQMLFRWEESKIVQMKRHIIQK